MTHRRFRIAERKNGRFKSPSCQGDFQSHKEGRLAVAPNNLALKRASRLNGLQAVATANPCLIRVNPSLFRSESPVGPIKGPAPTALPFPLWLLRRVLPGLGI